MLLFKAMASKSITAVMGRIPQTTYERTIAMRLQHVVYRVNELIEELRSNTKNADGRTRTKYYYWASVALENALDAALKEASEMTYKEID